jgi:NitT/TauT family transport system permease protein
LNSVESRGDTVVPKDAGKVSRLRQVRLPATLRYAMLLAALLGLWQIYVMFVGQISLPGPLEVAGALSEGWSGGRLAAATWMTLGTLALGMLIGAMIAVLLSVFAAWTRIGADLLTLLTLTLYPVPAIALLSLLILLFDTSPTSLVVVTVCSVTLPTAINLSAGLKSVNPTIMLVGQNLGLRGWGMFSAVLLPAALPHAISGLRAGWAYGWRTVIAANVLHQRRRRLPTGTGAPRRTTYHRLGRHPGRSDLPPAGARYRRPMGNEGWQGVGNREKDRTTDSGPRSLRGADFSW